MSFLDRSVTASEAARWCNVSRSLIDYWRTKGKLTPVGRFGRSRLYRLHDVVKVHADIAEDIQHSHRQPRAIDATEFVEA